MNQKCFLLLCGFALAVLSPTAAQAHGESRECFSYRAGSGTIEFCTGTPVRHYKKEKEPRQVVHHYYHAPHYQPPRFHHPVHAYGPPGHRKQKSRRNHEKKEQPGVHGRYVYKDGRWLWFR